MPHDAPTLLEDIRRALALIQQFTADRSMADYHHDELLRAGVEREFITIGEALSRLEKVDNTGVSQITDYRKIVDFRNVLVHGYQMIDDQIVWKVVQDLVPVLKQEVEALLTKFGPP